MAAWTQTANLRGPAGSTQASGVSVSPSGLVVVTGTDVQTALRQLDAEAVRGRPGTLLGLATLGGQSDAALLAGPSWTDVHTSLQVPVTVPASGMLYVRLESRANSNGHVLFWRVRLTPPSGQVSPDSLACQAGYERPGVTCMVPSQAPGLSCTVVWQHRSDVAAYTVANNDSALMQVYAG